ncbi:MAG: hypothetical protein L0216_14200 [Planctomycetales bacterium]|nr:hypothetical protein [Planctomycetales bacterium]
MTEPPARESGPSGAPRALVGAAGLNDIALGIYATVHGVLWYAWVLPRLEAGHAIAAIGSGTWLLAGPLLVSAGAAIVAAAWRREIPSRGAVRLGAVASFLAAMPCLLWGFYLARYAWSGRWAASGAPASPREMAEASLPVLAAVAHAASLLLWGLALGPREPFAATWRRAAAALGAPVLLAGAGIAALREPPPRPRVSGEGSVIPFLLTQLTRITKSKGHPSPPTEPMPSPALILDMADLLAWESGPGGRFAKNILHWMDSHAGVVPFLARMRGAESWSPLILAVLGRIGPDAAPAIPAVLEVLPERVWGVEGDSGCRQQAIRLLGSLGPVARSALPALRAIAGREDSAAPLAVRAIAAIEREATATAEPPRIR